ncbi:MAG: hypothetical protein P4L42_03810 [Desulfocapsaceae bacterium]|nr:hypothetical protein [Desulfocapsaceae bacterium]
MNILYIAQDNADIDEHPGPGLSVSAVSEENLFNRLQERPDALIVGGDTERQTEERIKGIRRNPRLCLTPIFLKTALPAYFDSVHDGIFTTYPDLVQKAEEINGRVRDMNHKDMMESQDYTLLAFLYSRNADLLPYKSPLSPQVYLFPLVEALGDPPQEIFRWITGLVERGLLAPERLVDRIRLCQKCEWSHLNYVDICPACQSLNILRVPFIHCFTCGHVAPQDKFLTEGSMQCPNCRTKLRHIGSDYDRPMENYSCLECSQSFVDPQIIAHCAHCDWKNNPEDLIQQVITTFRLTAKGKYSAKLGGIDDIYALLDNLNYVNPRHFMVMLDWLLLLCKRYPEDSFSIIGISIKNAIELTAGLGKHKVSTLVDTFARRLRELIRTTDITTRTSEHNLWLVLPKTSSAGCAVLAKKIMTLQDMTKQEDGSMLELKSITFTAPEDSNNAETAELLIARLTVFMEE